MGLQRKTPLLSALTGLLLLALAPHAASASYVTFGNGWGSKWDNPVHGYPATITWGFMPDGTTIDPARDIAAEVVGGSDITQMKSTYEAAYGAGSYLTAIQNALAAWEAACNVKFVGPIDDPNPGSPLPSGGAGAITPDIRIGAFNPVPGSGFNFVGGVGFGPPGDDINFPDPFAGDIMFNLSALFIRPAGNEDDPVAEFGNDLEGLMLHELGHAAIGLGHPADGPGEVMYVGPGAFGFINRQLSPDDIAGAQSVYGIPNPTPGDANFDGVVDGADYTIWADHFQQSGQKWETGDFNQDGIVNGADYTIWADHFAPGAAALPVPEPASFSLALIGALATLATRSRRRR
jgi:hypothetical protein